MTEFAGKHLVFIVENAPVPDDQRVWREAIVAKKMGFHVSVIAPKGTKHTESMVTIDGIDVFRYKHRMFAPGFLSYVVEYLNALTHTALLTIKLSRKRKIDAFHVANPPDIFFIIIGFFRLLGAKYIFDVHDLFANMFESKYEHSKSHLKPFVLSAVKAFEKINLFFADFVVVTNQSYMDYIAEHHKVPRDKIAIVRNAPPLDKRAEYAFDLSLKKNRRYLLVYFGLMGEDDGVDVVLKALHYIVTERHFDDFYCYLIGPTNIELSSAIKELKSLHGNLNLESYVEFTDYLPWSQVHHVLNTADLGLSPDLFTRQNNTSTMQKIMEYMSHGLPILSFELKENRFSAGGAAAYCTDYGFKEFGDRVIDLLENESVRKQMSEVGLERYRTKFNWESSAAILRTVYERVVKPASGP
jgi:glycosyltransferase involved in cell wall biosynthesis